MNQAETTQLAPPTIRLSVVIVNYNVRHFLEQALHSVLRAAAAAEPFFQTEVFVVDNNSVDGSQAMVAANFPTVKLIANKANVGFSRGNNAAIRQAKGDYVLLLNPDTVVEEDTFIQTVAFMDAHPDAGALGVKTLSGEGRFQPESKRSLPTPMVAFYKMFGLAWLFPQNKTFGRYHLTYLNPDQTHCVEVLSGSFMLLRHRVLDEVGLLDEQFFMYGEDIDLCYRIIQAGYKNYYYAGTKIIHYKGESTKKGSLNYVLVFYGAMMIFARKHYGGGQKRFFLFMIQAAIWLRASIEILRRVVNRLAFPALEFGAFIAVALGAKTFWEQVGGIPPLPTLFDQVVAPLYAAIFVCGLRFFGAYRRPYRVADSAAGIAAAFVAIATVSFWVREINFSRSIVALTAAGALLVALALRGLLNFLRTGSVLLDQPTRRRTIVVGSGAELLRVLLLLQKQLHYPAEIIGTVLPEQDSPQTAPTPQPQAAPAVADTNNVLGSSSQLAELIQYYSIDEVLFCNESLPTHTILNNMAALARPGLHFRIVPAGADYLVGPSVILAAPALKPVLYRLACSETRLQKRFFDGVVSAVLLLAFPLTAWAYQHPRKAFTALWAALRGSAHLVGYIAPENPALPPLKSATLTIAALMPPKRRQPKTHAARLDSLYARHYSFWLDLRILWRGFRHIGS